MARLDFATFAGAAVADLPPSAGDLFDLGLAYSTGDGVDMDLVAAHKWFNLAAREGDEEAAYHRQILAADMTDEEIAAAQRAAREWITRH